MPTGVYRTLMSGRFDTISLKYLTGRHYAIFAGQSRASLY